MLVLQLNYHYTSNIVIAWDICGSDWDIIFLLESCQLNYRQNFPFFFYLHTCICLNALYTVRAGPHKVNANKLWRNKKNIHPNFRLKMNKPRHVSILCSSNSSIWTCAHRRINNHYLIGKDISNSSLPAITCRGGCNMIWITFCQTKFNLCLLSETIFVSGL